MCGAHRPVSGSLLLRFQLKAEPSEEPLEGERPQFLERPRVMRPQALPASPPCGGDASDLCVSSPPFLSTAQSTAEQR